MFPWALRPLLPPLQGGLGWRDAFPRALPWADMPARRWRAKSQSASRQIRRWGAREANFMREKPTRAARFAGAGERHGGAFEPSLAAPPAAARSGLARPLRTGAPPDLRSDQYSFPRKFRKNPGSGPE